MRRVSIEEFLEGCTNSLLLDVRSPGEYGHAHIPGAINLPLFTDEERKVVGTTYKQTSREAAIKIGLDYFGPKMRGMVEEVEKWISNRQQAIDNSPHCQLPIDNCVFLYCWRGGMRSGAVAWLLNLYGFHVTVLAGGYKAFRNWVITTNSYPYRLQLLGGYTGSGKTALLKELEKQGKPVVDLEALANHKGSAFGNIGMPPQPSQEMFENILALKMTALYANAKAAHAPSRLVKGFVHWPQESIWMEDESQRIGQVNIPLSFWQNMRRSPIVFLDIPFEERLQYLVKEYGHLDKDRMIAAIERIAKRLGPLETKTAIQFLSENNVTSCFRILLQYYDKRYSKGLYSREQLPLLLKKIACQNVTVENAALVSQVEPASDYAGTH